MFNRFFLLVLGSIATLLMVIAGTIMAVDPLWIAPADLALTQYFCVKDERQNKSSKLVFSKEVYDTVIIGSSRVNNSIDFSRYGLKAYTYGLSGAFPHELKGYLDHFSQTKGSPRVIILGVDFYGTAKPTSITLLDRPAANYLAQINDAWFRFKIVTSWGALAYAFSTVTQCAPTPGEYGVYTKDGRMHVSRWPDVKDVMAKAKGNINFWRDYRYGRSYVFNEDLKTMYSDMRRAYPDAKFVVFTTPETTLMHKLILDTGHFDDYSRWLAILVDTFGDVYDFMGVNDISSDIGSRWYDAQHIYPEFTDIIYDRLLGSAQPASPGFGVLVTKSNLEDHIQAQRRAIQSLNVEDLKAGR